MVCVMAVCRSLTSSLLCCAAIALSSCGTVSSRTATTAGLEIGNYPVEASTEATPAIGPQVTVGSLTDPCALGLYDPWWMDHGGQVEFHRRCG